MERAWLRFTTRRPKDWGYCVVIGVDPSEYRGVTADRAAYRIVMRACNALSLGSSADLVLKKVNP